MKFKSGQNVVLKETGEKCRVMGYTKNGLVTLAKADGRLYGDFAEDAIAANSCASSNPVVQNALKACNDYIPEGWHRVGHGNFKNGDYLTLGNVLYKIVEPFQYSDEVKVKPVSGGMMKTVDLLHAVGPLAKNSTAVNSDEYIVRKSLSTSKWLLSKKATSLSGGEDKVFGSEQEARDFAKKNGLKVVNAFKPGDVVKYKTNLGPATGYFVRHSAMGYVVSDEKNGGKEHTIPEHWIMNADVVENEDAPMKRCGQDLTKAQEYLILAKQSIRPTMHDNAQEWFYEIDGIAKEVQDLRKRIVD